MKRYPYFCVELNKKEEEYFYIDNHRPVVISNSFEGVNLNTEESNYHMLAFAYYNDWIILDIYHGLTDGTGAYRLIRTLLNHYCYLKYGNKLSDDILLDNEISKEEWEDPLEIAKNLPVIKQVPLQNALSIIDKANLKYDKTKTVYSVTIDEKEFMRFSTDNDGSPATIVSLLLSRSIANLFPNDKDPIRIAMCLNQRSALKKPKAHQSLVGLVLLEYKEKMKEWSLDRQATSYRGMVFAQSMDEVVLGGANNMKMLSEAILSKKSDKDCIEMASDIEKSINQTITCVVSYVGKANFDEAEKHILDFRTWIGNVKSAPCVEISAVNGKFTIDFIQPFSSSILVDAFLKELKVNGVKYDFKGKEELVVPYISFPWVK